MTAGCAGRLFYFPDRQVYRLPSQAGLAYEDVTFQSRDGTRLHGWFVPARGGRTNGTVIHFHGNAQNLSSHFMFADWLPAEGFNVFIFDYRGYGASEGAPTRRGLYEDGRAALAHVAARPDVDPQRMVVLGQSLGGAVALTVLGRNHDWGVKAVAIDSTFYSYRSIVRDKIGSMPGLRYCKWPLSFLVIGNSYSPGAVVGRVSPVPLLLMHGTADQTIPAHHSQWLYQAASEPKQLRLIEGADHTEALTRFGDAYRTILVRFFLDALDGGK